MKIIEEIDKRVTDWLKFAEAKNAVITAFDSTISLAIIGLITKDEKLFVIPYWYLLLSLVLFLTGAVISLSSFLPKLNIVNNNKVDIAGDINLLFFFDIAKMNEKQYAQKIYDSYNLDRQFDRYDKDLINQVVSNSKITVEKFNLFSISIWLNLAVFLTPLILFVPIYRNLRSNNRN